MKLPTPQAIRIGVIVVTTPGDQALGALGNRLAIARPIPL